MKNDLQERSTPGPINLEEVKSLWKYRVHRQPAEIWATRDIRFLICDDTDDLDDTPEDDNEDEDAMLARAIALSLEQEQEVVTIDNDSAGPSSTSLEDSSGKHDNDRHCRVCSGLPEFRHDRKTRKFRIFSPADLSPQDEWKCPHYVAVSYCWPEPVLDENGKILKTTEGMYEVREPDGTVRRNRALDEVVDRAVVVANSFGLRMIWIDQECLPQPIGSPDDEDYVGLSEDDRAYQQLGIQAMDIVYNRSAITAGLHSGELQSQDELDSIMELIEFDKTKHLRRNRGPQILTHAFDFIKAVCQDRWYTRAWVAQESLSAGNGLVLLFRLKSGICNRPSFKLTGAFQPPPHSLDNSPVRLSDDFMIGSEEFRGLVRATKLLAAPYFRALGQTLVHIEESSLSLLSVAERLHPKALRTKMSPQILSSNVHGGRSRVNAAGALTILSTRHCRDTEDRIAILANLCGYELHLNTFELAKHCTSLRMGLLSLALLNGDLSLLVPEVYSLPRLEQVSDRQSAPSSVLVSPFTTSAGRVSHFRVQQDDCVTPRSHRQLTRARNPGLTLAAYMWTVDHEIDMSMIRYQWSEQWHNLKCLRLEVEEGKGKESAPEAFHKRRISVAQHFSSQNRMQQALDETFQFGEVPADSAVWAGLEGGSEGIQCIAHLNAARVESDPRARQLVARIFFDILRYLFSLGTEGGDPCAIGAANSIWQSVRVEAVNDGSKSNDKAWLPDEVGDELFSHPDCLKNPFETLQLDKNDDGSYNLTWFIDRIMQHGTLWVGRYVRNTRVLSETAPQKNHKESPIIGLASEETSKDELSFEVHQQEGHARAQSKSRGEDATMTEGPEITPTHTLHPATNLSNANQNGKGKQPVPKKFIPNGNPTIVGRQLVLQMFTGLVKSQRPNVSPSSQSSHPSTTQDDPESYIDDSSVTFFAYVLSRGIWSAEAEDHRVRTLASVFDVDGPCTVVTPFNSDWERLPHPDIRGMSCCWVVEPLVTEEEKQAKEKERAGEEVSAVNTSGVMAPPKIDDFKLETEEGAVAPKAQAHSDGVTINGTIDHNHPSPPLYRVMRKVKGMWEIMEYPYHEYSFV